MAGLIHEQNSNAEQSGYSASSSSSVGLVGPIASASSIGSGSSVGLVGPITSSGSIASKLRVAAYIRVSTDKEMQENSFELQERYYTDYIRSNPDWRMIGIYSDYALTGTSKEKRSGFQRLMRHCAEGKIDRVLCKSLSRFARNTIDTLDAVRKLKDLGISVFFEKEKLDSLDIQSEFVLSTIAAIAQEESRSISENMRLAYQHRSEAGQLPMVRIMGYRISGTGKRGHQTVTIDPDEAETVRMIFKAYIDGVKIKDIADNMMEQGRKNVHGNVAWTGARVRAILINEKYTGDYKTQKTYTADYLTHRVKKNCGEMEQYLIEGHHEAIVDRETWNTVQLLIFKRHGWGSRGNVHPFTGRLHCTCGANYQRTDGQSRFKWVCGKRKSSKKLCESDGIFEDVLVASIKPAFLHRFGKQQPNGTLALDVKKLLMDLKTLQNFDNVERQRVVMKRQIASATDASVRRGLEDRLAFQEHLWELLEADRTWRAMTIEWLKGMEDHRVTTDQLMDSMDGSLLRAWFTDGTVHGDKLTVLWMDGSTDEVQLLESKKKRRAKTNVTSKKGEQ